MFDRVLYIGTNIWALCFYFEKVSKNQPLAYFYSFVAPIALIRAIVLAVELRLALARIIDLDVTQRNKEIDSEAAKSDKSTVKASEKENGVP